MGIGPVPPYSPSYSPSGGPQLPDYAGATLWSQLAGVAPTGVASSSQVSAGQQNTFWLLRAYSDIMMLELATATQPPFYTPSMAASITQGLLKDLKYITAQATAGGTGFDPAVTASIQFVIGQNGNLGSEDLELVMQAFNSVIQGKPQPGYDPNTPYDFRKLLPDDMYNIYLISMVTPVLSYWRFGPPQTLPSMPDILQLSANGNSSLLASQLPEFFITYFVQRDGMGTAALANDLNNFQTLIGPLLAEGSSNMFPGLEAVILGGKDPNGKPFLGLQYAFLEMTSRYDIWPFSTPTPTGDNNTPPPYWDVSGNQQPNWTYTPDYNFLFQNDENLYFYLQAYRHPGGT